MSSIQEIDSICQEVVHNQCRRHGLKASEYVTDVFTKFWISVLNVIMWEKIIVIFYYLQSVSCPVHDKS